MKLIMASMNNEHKTYSKAMTEGNKFECKQCDKAFKMSSNLTRHIQSAHVGVKYACNQCNKQFTEQSSLTMHIHSQI